MYIYIYIYIYISAVHLRSFVDQFCLFFIKFTVQNASVVQIRD